MKTQIENTVPAIRPLTTEELTLVSGGAMDARARHFNPQPDPPGAMSTPPTC